MSDFDFIDIDLNGIIDELDLGQLDLDQDDIPYSIDSDLAGIKGVSDQYEIDLLGTIMPDHLESDLNNNLVIDQLEQNLLGYKVVVDLNQDGKIDDLDRLLFEHLTKSKGVIPNIQK